MLQLQCPALCWALPDHRMPPNFAASKQITLSARFRHSARTRIAELLHQNRPRRNGWRRRAERHGEAELHHVDVWESTLGPSQLGYHSWGGKPMSDAGDCRCAAIGERAAEAWIAFLNRTFSGQTIGDVPLVDLSAVREADTYLRGLARHPERFGLDEVVRHTRAIFEHPLRSAYLILFPSNAHTHDSRAPYVFKDLTYGTSIIEGRRRVFIANQLGELVSGDVVNDKLQPWCIKALGLSPHEFLYLTPHQMENVRTVFTSALFQRAAELREAPLHFRSLRSAAGKHPRARRSSPVSR
jgi:hypothetical protein